MQIILTESFGAEVERAHYPKQPSILHRCLGLMKAQVMSSEENPTWEKVDSTRRVAIPLLGGHYPMYIVSKYEVE